MLRGLRYFQKIIISNIKILFFFQIFAQKGKKSRDPERSEICFFRIILTKKNLASLLNVIQDQINGKDQNMTHSTLIVFTESTRHCE